MILPGQLSAGWSISQLTQRACILVLGHQYGVRMYKLDVPSNRWTIYKSALNTNSVGCTDLSNELSRNTIRLDLPHQLRSKIRLDKEAHHDERPFADGSLLASNGLGTLHHQWGPHSYFISSSFLQPGGDVHSKAAYPTTAAPATTLAPSLEVDRAGTVERDLT